MAVPRRRPARPIGAGARAHAPREAHRTALSLRRRAVEARDARIADLERELEAARESHQHREAQLHASCQAKLEAMRDLHAQQLAGLRQEAEVRKPCTGSPAQAATESA
jgi:hypothetical protein